MTTFCSSGYDSLPSDFEHWHSLYVWILQQLISPNGVFLLPKFEEMHNLLLLNSFSRVKFLMLETNPLLLLIFFLKLISNNKKHNEVITPWKRVLHKKLIATQLVKKFPSFYGTRRFITMFTRSRHWSLSWVTLINLKHQWIINYTN
jgi:hypothetical protein